MAFEVDRKIHFYRVEGKRDDEGNLLPYDPVPVLDYIDGLSQAADRRLDLGDGNSSFCWVHSRTAPQRLRLATVRRSALPSVETRGQVSFLDLDEDAGLADMTHVVFFDNNIAGADFNSYGPRLNRLAEYMTIKANGVGPLVAFSTLLNPDVAQKLNNFEEIRLVDYRIRAADVEVLAQKNESLFRALRATRELGEAGEVGLVLKPEKHKRENIGHDPLNMVKQIANNDESRNASTRFKVKGVDENGLISEVDILNDQLLATKKVMRMSGQYRTIIPSSAFDAIEEAYDDMEPDIKRAAGIDS